MSLFEYLAIALTLVISSSVMRLADGLSESFRGPEPSRLYQGQLLVALVANVAAFWNFWSFHDASWTFARFVLALSGPVALFFASASLVPSDADSVDSWSTHSRAVRRRFYAAICVWAVLIAATTTVLLDMGWRHPARAAELITLSIGCVGAFSERDRVHGILVAFTLLFALVALSTLAARPGSFN